MPDDNRDPERDPNFDNHPILNKIPFNCWGSELVARADILRITGDLEEFLQGLYKGSIPVL